MTERIFTGTDAISYGWAETKPRLGSLFLGLGALTLVLGALEGSAQRNGHGLLHLLLQIASMLVTMGWWRITLRVRDRAEAGLEALRETTLVGAVTYGVTIFLFWVATILGLVALVLPGLVIGARLFLAPVVVIDQGRDPIAALRHSWELTEGHVIPLLTFGAMLLVMNLLGAIPFGLGLLVTIPVTFLAVVDVYRRLEAARDAGAGYRVAPHAPA